LVCVIHKYTPTYYSLFGRGIKGRSRRKGGGGVGREKQGCGRERRVEKGKERGTGEGGRDGGRR